MDKLPCRNCQTPTEVIPFGGKFYAPLCATCEAEEFKASGLAALAEAERIRRQRLWNSICPAAYQETLFEKLPCPQKTNRVLAWKYGPKGLILWGPTRLGKSRSAYLLLHKYFHAGKTVAAYDCIRFAEECEQNKYGSKAALWTRSLASVDLLLLDDLDKDRLVSHQEGKLFGVFDRRCANKKPTLFTCNASGTGLLDCFRNHGKEFVARMREFSEAIRF